MKERFDKVTSGPWVTAGDDVQYRIERQGPVLILTFQGSVSNRDWINNFAFAAAPYKDMPVKWRAHRGFVRMWKSVRDEVMGKVKEAVLDGVQVIQVYGYSQGGALAVLALEDVNFTFGLDVLAKGLVFGCPRVLMMPSKVVRGRFWNLTRYEVRGDIVTMLPPWLFGYGHVGVRQRIGKPAFPWWTRHLEGEYSGNME